MDLARVAPASIMGILPPRDGRLIGLPAKVHRIEKRGDDRGVRFDDVLGGVFSEFAPGDLLIGNGSRVASMARGGVADLAEVAAPRRS